MQQSKVERLGRPPPNRRCSVASTWPRTCSGCSSSSSLAITVISTYGKLMTTSHLLSLFSQILRVEETLHSHCHFATHYMEGLRNGVAETISTGTEQGLKKLGKVYFTIASPCSHLETCIACSFLSHQLRRRRLLQILRCWNRGGRSRLRGWWR